MIQVRNEAIQVEGSFGGDLDFIDSPEMLRTVAKTAYTALALRIGVKFARLDTFDDLWLHKDWVWKSSRKTISQRGFSDRVRSRPASALGRTCGQKGPASHRCDRAILWGTSLPRYAVGQI